MKVYFTYSFFLLTSAAVHRTIPHRKPVSTLEDPTTTIELSPTDVPIETSASPIVTVFDTSINFTPIEIIAPVQTVQSGLSNTTIAIIASFSGLGLVLLVSLMFFLIRRRKQLKLTEAQRKGSMKQGRAMQQDFIGMIPLKKHDNEPEDAQIYEKTSEIDRFDSYYVQNSLYTVKNTTGSTVHSKNNLSETPSYDKDLNARTDTQYSTDSLYASIVKTPELPAPEDKTVNASTQPCVLKPSFRYSGMINVNAIDFNT